MRLPWLAAPKMSQAGNLAVLIVDQDDVVLFQHGHEYGFMLALPELALVEFGFHWLAGL